MTCSYHPPPSGWVAVPKCCLASKSGARRPDADRRLQQWPSHKIGPESLGFRKIQRIHGTWWPSSGGEADKDIKADFEVCS